jgi:hypothetical protein
LNPQNRNVDTSYPTLNIIVIIKSTFGGWDIIKPLQLVDCQAFFKCDEKNILVKLNDYVNNKLINQGISAG